MALNRYDRWNALLIECPLPPDCILSDNYSYVPDNECDLSENCTRLPRINIRVDSYEYQAIDCGKWRSLLYVYLNYTLAADANYTLNYWRAYQTLMGMPPLLYREMILAKIYCGSRDNELLYKEF